jgi:acetyl esterase/lipase
MKSNDLKEMALEILLLFSLLGTSSAFATILTSRCGVTAINPFLPTLPSTAEGISRIEKLKCAMKNPVSAPEQASSTKSFVSNNSRSSNHVLSDRWEELEGNYVIRPNVEDGPPRALLHFLGGALVGAVPHVSYRYLLERLASKGYLVIATPYNLSFDHLETCDIVIQRFEKIAPMLARQYGAIPVVGVGHSCGALLQLLITSLFPDTPRAANALISFNNKPVKDAIPFFEEIFAPLFTAAASKDDTTSASGIDLITVGLQLARSASEGTLPSDELLAEVNRILTPQMFRGLPKLELSSQLRESIQTLISPSVTALNGAGILPFLHPLVDTLDQIPLLMQEVAEGARDFVPTPSNVRAAARRAYRARRTLLIQFDQDTQFDESEDIEQLLKEAESMTRMKRPMIDIDVQRTKLPGVHVTPLVAPPLDIASRAEDFLGKEAAQQNLLYAPADATVEELVRWLEEANL